MFHLVFTLIVFFGIYVWLATDTTPRHLVVIWGALALYLGRVLTLNQMWSAVDWDMIALLFGTFTMVAALSESGFFAWLGLSLARRLDLNPRKIFFTFPLLAGLLSMFLNNITVMMLMATLTLDLCEALEWDPLLLIIAEVCVANTAGSMTLIGSPPNLVMGLAFHVGFARFAMHMAPIMGACTMVTLGTLYAGHKNDIVSLPADPERGNLRSPPSQALLNRGLLISGLTALGISIVLMIAQPYLIHRLPFDFTLGLAAFVPAVVLVGVEFHQARRITRQIDLATLVFFMGLFVIIGALEQVGVFRWLAGFLGRGGLHPLVLILLLMSGAALVSAWVDNVPMALSLAYLLKEMHSLPGTPPQRMLMWAALVGLSIGGNLTPIGASPNIVAYTLLERRRTKIGWNRWIRLTLPPIVATLIVASGLLAFKYRTGWF